MEKIKSIKNKWWDKISKFGKKIFDIISKKPDEDEKIKKQFKNKLTWLIYFTTKEEKQYIEKIIQKYSPQELNEILNNMNRLNTFKEYILYDFLEGDINIYSETGEIKDIKKLIHDLANNIPINRNFANINFQKACTATYSLFSQALKDWTITINTTEIDEDKKIVLWKFMSWKINLSNSLLINPFSQNMDVYKFQTDQSGKIIKTELEYNINKYKKEIWEQKFKKIEIKNRELKNKMIELVKKYYPEMYKEVYWKKI